MFVNVARVDVLGPPWPPGPREPPGPLDDPPDELWGTEAVTVSKGE